MTIHDRAVTGGEVCFHDNSTPPSEFLISVHLAYKYHYLLLEEKLDGLDSTYKHQHPVHLHVTQYLLFI